MNTKCRVKTHFLQKEKKKEKEGRREGDEGKEGGREKKKRASTYTISPAGK